MFALYREGKSLADIEADHPSSLFYSSIRHSIRMTFLKEALLLTSAGEKLVQKMHYKPPSFLGIPIIEGRPEVTSLTPLWGGGGQPQGDKVNV